ncbi:MAG TPA: cytochrome c biogenesis protein CcsA [Pyrinomonadaceae bacterium]|nr:cytochrome c biogenesis protein CcsA [Pyrinomonadaceae bacterium]
MKLILFTALAAYVIAAIHSLLAFVNKRSALERIALWTAGCGFALHTASLVIDWVQDGRYPLYGLRETLSFLAWTIVATYFIVLSRYRAQALGTFSLPLVSLLTFAVILSHEQTNGAQGAAGSSTTAAWMFPVHTTLLVFAYAAFFVVFIASVMYLLQERELKLKTFSAIFHRLPSLTTVNEIATLAAGVGLMLLSLGILTGMLWSSERDGRIWHNDPKEILAGLTWLLYMFLILYRASARWRGRRAAWLGVMGFALVLCTFFGARLMGSYHVFG